MGIFKLASDFKPSGDQPEAIASLSKGLESAKKYQTLLGVTGSGKTFTIANVIQKYDRPVLVMSHNKTLAAQLYTEFKTFFPENAVEYFISYYDYYLPEAYIPQTDTYIAKDASINEDIERLRLSTTASLLERRDVIVIASVSCIYGLGSPQDYEQMCVTVEKGMKIDRDEFLLKLICIQYERNDTAPEKGNFRVRGDSVDVFVPQRLEFIRVEFWGDTVESLHKCDPLTGNIKEKVSKAVFFPCKHFVMPPDRIELASQKIISEMKERVKFFEERNLLVEAQRIHQRTIYDMEMLKEIGYCSGVENYSLHLANRMPGSRPSCLIDFFPKDFITVVDESHVTLPQIRAMFKGDRSRKQTLVDHGFRLPSALDNRPLTFEEFTDLTQDSIYVSATPGDYEVKLCGSTVDQVVRPTGLLDPEISIRPLKGQIDDLINEIRRYAERNERVLVTTLTKKNSERLADYLVEAGLKVKYIHSELDALQRAKVICDLRKGDFDCLVGINLLREGIDLPEVALVAILDADKEGFLRSARSLIQVAGRAARNINGKVILYADRLTDSIKNLVTTTNSRRRKQEEYNIEHNIEPKSIVKAIREDISIYFASEKAAKEKGRTEETELSEDIITELEKEMLDAAEALEFERAAYLRDIIKQHRIQENESENRRTGEAETGRVEKPDDRRQRTAGKLKK
ncbi:MAG TPA: excinuclease ABC subunit B [Lentisphaeria bacterium]|nr:MAG: excinuclease ABC subunit B [Lentisphaerae bacterium GWF2_50_93]HCE43206.1 excinuclease ABC subunit B [Lentisphaeria bacterium]